MTIIDPTYVEGDVGGEPNPANLWGQSPCIKFTSGETNSTEIVSGFTLARWHRHAHVRRCSEPHFCLRGRRWAVASCATSRCPRSMACIIRNNHVATDGGGVYSGGQSEPILTGPTYLCNNSPNHLFGFVDVVDACMSPTCEDDNGDSIPDSCQGVPTTHFVGPDDGPTAIADAIALANSGDTISLAAGTYLETINPMGKAIQFVGAGPWLTILDGMWANENRVITCLVGETNGTTFSDLTVTSGNATRGGGAVLRSSSPVFTNVEFFLNLAEDSGGAIYMSNGAQPVFTECIFDDNIADWMGGAIYALAGCRPVFTNTTFNNNQSGIAGGAVCLITAPSGLPPSYPAVYPHGLIGNRPEFTECTFTNNRAQRYGGGSVRGLCFTSLVRQLHLREQCWRVGLGAGYTSRASMTTPTRRTVHHHPMMFMDYYPHVHNGTVFSCCEPQAISGDGQAWYDPWWGEMTEEANCQLCAPDVNKDLYVDHLDLFEVIDAWGNCEDMDPDDPDSPPAPGTLRRGYRWQLRC